MVTLLVLALLLLLLTFTSSTSSTSPTVADRTRSPPPPSPLLISPAPPPLPKVSLLALYLPLLLHVYSTQPYSKLAISFAASSPTALYTSLFKHCYKTAPNLLLPQDSLITSLIPSTIALTPMHIALALFTLMTHQYLLTHPLPLPFMPPSATAILVKTGYATLPIPTFPLPQHPNYRVFSLNDTAYIYHPSHPMVATPLPETENVTLTTLRRYRKGGPRKDVAVSGGPVTFSRKPIDALLSPPPSTLLLRIIHHLKHTLSPHHLLLYIVYSSHHLLEPLSKPALLSYLLHLLSTDQPPPPPPVPPHFIYANTTVSLSPGATLPTPVRPRTPGTYTLNIASLTGESKPTTFFCSLDAALDADASCTLPPHCTIIASPTPNATGVTLASNVTHARVPAPPSLSSLFSPLLHPTLLLSLLSSLYTYLSTPCAARPFIQPTLLRLVSLSLPRPPQLRSTAEWESHIKDINFFASRTHNPSSDGTRAPYKEVSALSTIVFDKTGTLTTDSMYSLPPHFYPRTPTAVKNAVLLGGSDRLDQICSKASNYTLRDLGIYSSKGRIVGEVLTPFEFNRTTRLGSSSVVLNASNVTTIYRGAPGAPGFPLNRCPPPAALGGRRIYLGVDDPREPHNIRPIGHVDFATRMRPEAPRVIKEVVAAGMRPLIVTGDNFPNAVWAGTETSLLSAKPAVLVDVRNNRLVSSNGTRKARKVTSKTVKCLFSSNDGGRGGRGGRVVLSGAAFQLAYSSPAVPAHALLLSKFHLVSVVCKATPFDKKCIIEHLKPGVMMVGDGVNDVQAMKAADVSVALFQGYDDGTAEDPDRELEGADADLDKGAFHRARKALSNLRDNTRLSLRGVGDGSLAATMRLLRQYNATESISETLRYEWERMKVQETGGAELVKLVEDERRLKETILGPEGGDCDTAGASDNTVPPSSSSDDDDDKCRNNLATETATYQSLEPSISSVPKLVRLGVAFTNSDVNTQKTIALESLLMTFQLTILSKVGWSDAMWPVSNMISGYLYAGVDDVGMTPGNWIGGSRPTQSLWGARNLLSLCSQGAVHAVTLVYVLRLAEEWNNLLNIKVQLRSDNVVGGKIASFGLGKGGGKGGIKLGYRPNYKSDAVYVMAVVQTFVVSVVNGDFSYSGDWTESVKYIGGVGLNLTYIAGLLFASFVGEPLQMCGWEAGMANRLVTLILLNGAGSLVASKVSTLLTN